MIVLTGNEGDSHSGCVSVVKSNCDSVAAAVGPVLVGDSVTGLGPSFIEVGRDVDLDSELFWELRCTVRVIGLRVTARDENASVGKELQYASV